MLGRHKLLFFTPVILLILVFLGMTPLNLAHRLASGGPFTHGKQSCWNNHCPFHSIVSNDDLPLWILSSTALDQESLPVQDFGTSLLESINPNISFNSVPLRC
jgi:hypothetical protein